MISSKFIPRIALCLILSIGLIMVSLYFNAKTVAVHQQLFKTRQEQRSTTQKIQASDRELAQKESLRILHQHAQTLSMDAPKRITYLPPHHD